MQLIKKGGKNIIEHIISKNKYDISLIDKLTNTKNKEKQSSKKNGQNSHI